jgi:hypothetical protein
MAEFIFNPEVTIQGHKAKRGQEILVGWYSLVRTAHINTITEQINARGNYYVTANVMMGGGNNPLPGKPPIEAVDSGFYHLDDPHPTGNRFVFPEEGEEACKRLNDLMQGRATPPPAEVVEVVEEPAQGNAATFAPPQPPAFNPADFDRDGTVSPKEQKRHDKMNRQ